MRGNSCDCRRHDWSRKGVKDAGIFPHTKPQSHEERFCVSIENPRETVFSLRRRSLFTLFVSLRVLVSLCAIQQVYVDRNCIEIGVCLRGSSQGGCGGTTNQHESGFVCIRGSYSKML
ncbi:MAG: hypothetical protein [Olavius algarvensis Gamma 1 endosymbiont]|nr:MAG: hypothetical protein [Olavius algarvensis Gamma 1 endosymbiont]